MSKIITYSFCESFIDNLIHYLEEEYLQKGKDMSRLAIVFGGKRPALFVRRELARKIQKVFNPPRFFTINEFVGYVARQKQPFRQAEDLDDCFLLYTLAKETVPQILAGRETFAQFLPWAREILNFIDQLDLENIADDDLKNIQANAQIGYAVPDEINQMLQHVVALRHVYHKQMEKQKVYSRGFQYRRAAELIDGIGLDDFDEVLFCNFFYFNRSEKALVESLLKRNQAALLFQGDERKWPILKKIAKDFSCTLKEGEKPEKTSFDLNFYSGMDGHAQIGIVREILKNVKNLEKTVVVLPNPDHIVPLLSEVTSITDEFNISMGYPLKRSSLYTLCEFVFQAQRSQKKRLYYTKDYLKVLRHPFVKNLKLGEDPAVTRIFIHKIEEILTGKEKTSISGSLFIHLEDIVSCDDVYLLTQQMLKRLGIMVHRDDLVKALKEIHSVLFEQWEEVVTFRDFAGRFQLFLDLLVEKSFLKRYPLNLNIAAKMYSVREELEKAAFCDELFGQEEIFRIFDDKISAEIIAFQGSPLKGLQILGLFETRSLNFENVIILDVNEGALPRLKIYEPLIPREVMISLNLDRLEMEEEIQRYQFMRLISSAKNVHLVYQEGKDKERSRFVEELVWEKQKEQKKTTSFSVRQARHAVNILPLKTVIPKTPQMVEHLRNMRFSASSVNMYLRSPVDFYYSYVLGLRETEDLLDEPEARQVGTFIHELLEEAFKPFLKKAPQISDAFRQRFIALFEQHFARTFGRSMKSDAFLLRSVLVDRLNRFLDNEQNSLDRRVKEIVCLEQAFEDELVLSCGTVKFKYIVDRIDRMHDGTVMVIDYKTGSVNLMPKGIEYIKAMDMSRQVISEQVGSFQMPLYFQFLLKEFKDQTVNSAMYNLRTLKINKFITPKMKCSYEEVNEIFLKPLDYIISEILDSETPFSDNIR